MFQPYILTEATCKHWMIPFIPINTEEISLFDKLDCMNNFEVFFPFSSQWAVAVWYTDLSSRETECHSGGSLSIRNPIAGRETLITLTPLLFKFSLSCPWRSIHHWIFTILWWLTAVLAYWIFPYSSWKHSTNLSETEHRLRWNLSWETPWDIRLYLIWNIITSPATCHNQQARLHQQLHKEC